RSPTSRPRCGRRWREGAWREGRRRRPGPRQALPALPLAAQAHAELPVPPHLQRVRDPGRRDARRRQGPRARDVARPALPPVQPRRLRPRAAARRRAPRPRRRGHDGAPRPHGGTLTARPALTVLAAALLLALAAPVAAARQAIESGPFEPGGFRGLD